MRELGTMLYARTAGEPAQRERLRRALGLTPAELERLYAGRLFLTGDQLQAAAQVCDTRPVDLLVQARQGYAGGIERRVHCMTPFSDPRDREQILDLIDAYIDAREALHDRQ